MKLWKEKPLLRSTDSYIPAVNTAKFLTGKNKILIVGDAGGRDYQYLKSLGKELYVLDISPQEGIPNLILQSIEEKTPFEDNFFDGAVVNEVLEHIFDDISALEEIHRILKKDGILVVTVPYFSNVQDNPEYHVRIHSPKTMRRLLERSGFEIEDHFCRGFCTRFVEFNFLTTAFIYMLHKIVEITTKKSPDDSVAVVNGTLEKFERFLGTHAVTIKFQKWFTSYGGIMKARKISKKKNFNDLQVEQFQNKFFT
ncbi:class I SAM-dependent methyltransferase [Candidatus Latescibacterota bacterium]